MNSALVLLVFMFACVFAQNFKRELYEGDDCELPYQEQGICVRISLCPPAIEIVQQKQQPKRCGFVRSIPIICCSKSQAKITRLAELKCLIFQIPGFTTILQHQENPPTIDISRPFLPSFPPNLPNTQILNYNIKSGETNTRNSRVQQKFGNQPNPPPLQHTPSVTNWKISSTNDTYDDDDTLSSEFKPDFHKFVIGGENALIREFPHMAALGYSNNRKIIWLCGGTLISDEYVLTAAHCLHSNVYGPLEWVRLGELNLASAAEQNDPQNYKVIRKIAHPYYQLPSVYHDIALVQLDRSIVITSYVKPACLFTQNYIPSDVELSATGWGLTQVGGTKSDILQKVDLDLFTEDECDNAYENVASTRRLKNGILHRQQICAGGRNEEKDTCQGDSGGPLQIQINDEEGERFYVVGVTSFGRSCGIQNIPAIYTKVSFYVPWIESVLWPNEKY